MTSGANSLASNLEELIASETQSSAFQNYLQVRERVVKMMEEDESSHDHPSDYWQEEIAGFEYLLDASPLILRKLREHCYHITGLRSYDYRSHHCHQQEAFARKLEALRRLDHSSLLVPESPLLGGFGHEIDGALFNLDTLKFYEALIALDKAGVLAPFRGAGPSRKIVLEIGAGWGGFAFQFKTLFPNVTYVIIDLPQTLMISSVYLKTLYPEAVTLFYGEEEDERLPDLCDQYDFVFLPHFMLPRLSLRRIDLAVNMVSFQEMTTAQVYQYARKLAEAGCSVVYSLNRDKSPNNSQLDSVSSVLGSYYDLTEVQVLDVPYTSLTLEPTRPLARNGLKQLIRWLARRNADQRMRKTGSKSYRHLIGLRKPHLERVDDTSSAR